MKYMIDGREFKSKKKAMICCEGSEGERMTFAYCKIKEGCNVIDTRTGYAVKPIKKERK